jgi:hypothetical protein
MAFDFHVPATPDLILAAFSGLCGGIAHMFLMAAMRAAPANRVAPTQYSQIVWAKRADCAEFGGTLNFCPHLSAQRKTRLPRPPYPPPPDIAPTGLCVARRGILARR